MEDDFVMISPQQKVMENDIENQLDNVTNDDIVLDINTVEKNKEDSPVVESFLSEEQLIDMLKDDLDFINRRIPCIDSDCNMTDSCTQTSDVEDDDIPKPPEDDKNIFTSLIEYMFGDDGVVTHMFDNFPTLDEMRDNFKESSVYRFFSFIFK